MSILPLVGSENLHERLRHDIITGALAPRRKLRLEKLREDYAVSVSSLREVLSRLLAEGLILFEAQKGFEVAPISADDLREICEMRFLLEAHAIEASFEKGDLDWEARLVGAHHKLARLESLMLAGETSVTEKWKRYDRDFHVALISGCAAPELLAAHERIFDRFQRYQLLLVMFRGQEAAQEHHDLLAAALNRDKSRAQEILRRHIEACLDFTAKHDLFAQQGQGEAAQNEVPQFPARPTIGASLYQHLRSDIIMGHLQPGQKLRLEQLRKTYDAGANTLREALSRLTADGFVLAEAQRGFEVTPISPQGLHDVADLRLMLEEHALARSFANGGLDWEASVIAAHHRLEAHEERLEAGDTSDLTLWREADWQFHQALISACGSQVMRASHAEVFDKYLRYQMIALAFRPSASRPEHRSLMEAALARDIPHAQTLLRHHIHAGVQQALELGFSSVI